MIQYTYREKVIALAWWMEAEGSFMATTSSKCMKISSAQVQKWPLERLQEWFGGKIYVQKKGGPRRDLSHWHVSGVKAASLAMMVYQFMSPKRKEQIRKALSAWRSTRIAPQYRTHCPRGHPLPAKQPGDRQRYCGVCRPNLVAWVNRERMKKVGGGGGGRQVS